MFSKDQFNYSIKEFHQKYSDKWTLITHKDDLRKSSQNYLKMSSVYEELEIDSYIIYSETYCQPVLFFLPMTISDDSKQFTSFDNLKPFLNSDFGSIALAENPINGLLMYNIHPCSTAEFMQEILNSISGEYEHKNSYIESWLSFCPFVPVKKSLNF